MLTTFLFAVFLVAICFGHIRIAVVAACIFAGVALAQGTPVPGDPELDLVLKLVDQAIATKNPVVLAPVAVIGIVAVMRKFVPWAPLKTDRGGAVLSLVTSLAVSVGGALLLGHPLSLGLVVSAGVSLVSAGGYALGKKLLAPSDAPKCTCNVVGPIEGHWGDCPVCPKYPSPIDLANRRGPQP